MLYPLIDETMKIEERAHAFHVNKSALRLSRLPIHSYLDALGNQLGTTTTIEGKKFDFQHEFDANWANPANLTVISFHSSTGAIMNDAHVANNPSILKPVQNGAVADCRPDDVRFVRVSCSIDFVDLITVAAPGASTVLRTSFYIELPQTTVAMNNGAAVPIARNLTTFHGPDDLTTMSPAAFKTTILDNIDYPMPISLAAPAWNVNEANIDAVETRLDIERKYLTLGLETMEKAVFEELCPGYTNKPHAAVESITQVVTDADGNKVTTPFHQYYKRIMQGSRSFAHQTEWPVSVSNICINNMCPRLRSAFEELFPRHNEPHDRRGRLQREILQDILQKATMAEAKIRTIQNIAWNAAGGQGFCADADTFASQAETTLGRYQKPPTPRKPGSRIPICWGCQEDHVWCGRDRIVTCPNKDRPGVKATAEKVIAERKKQSADRKKNRDQNKDSPSKRKKINYDDLTAEEQQHLLRQALASHAESPSTVSSVTAPSTSGSSRQGPQMFLCSVFSSMSINSKPVLPIPIQSNFPHIAIQFGLELNDADCPCIHAVIDTAASLTTGRSDFFFEIARKFPHCVAAVYTDKTYSPITLSGIIRQGEMPVTSDLPVGFAFHMPYKTRSGSDTQFMVACGPNVAVNCILGLPFLKATHMVYDASDSVADCKLLDCPPFQIEYKRAVASVPTLDRAPNSVNYSEFQPFLDQLDELENHLANVCATMSAPTSEQDTKMPAISSAPSALSGSLPPCPANLPDTPVGTPPTFRGFQDTRASASDDDDYHDAVYGDAGSNRE